MKNGMLGYVDLEIVCIQCGNVHCEYGFALFLDVQSSGNYYFINNPLFYTDAQYHYTPVFSILMG